MREISARFGFDVDPDALVEDLPVGVQQRVEIIKALSRDAKVLVFDEPTAVLTPQETDELMAIMRQLKAAGTSIVFITHKLREVREVADRITVIRLGKVVGEASPTATNAELASLMVGRAVELTVHKGPPKPGEPALVVKDLSRHRPARAVVVDDVSFHGARAARSSPSPACRATARPSSPRRSWACSRASPATSRSTARTAGPARAARSSTPGVGFVPEDRNEDGLVGEFTIAENLMLDRSDRRAVRRAPATCSWAYLAEFAEREDHGVRHPRARASAPTVGQLSGGNQQKVVLARELSRDLRLFVAAQPTRGVDVGSIEFVHKRIVATRDAGIPVIVVSTELDEVAALADRIAVMYRGSIVGIVPGDTPRDVLGLMMAGETPERGGRMSDAAAARAGTHARRRVRSRPGADARAVRRGRRTGGPPPTRAVARTVLREITTGGADHLGARRRARADRRRRPDRRHRRERADRGRATSSPGPADMLQRHLGLPSPARTASLFQGSVYNFRRAELRQRHPAAHRDPHLRDPAHRRGPRRRRSAFRAGMFNIGGRGQMLIAAAVAGWVGFAFDLPCGIHMLVALVAGIVGGGALGGHRRAAQGPTGAHEVIVTIMLNYVAFYLVTYLLRTPGLLQAPGLEQPEDAGDEADGDLPRRCSARSTTCTSASSS